MTTTIVILIAIVIILALGVYAGRLLYMLKQQTHRHTAARNKRTHSITESIVVIAKAMEQQQCDLSEGTIRIVHLLNALPLESPPNFAKKFPNIHTLFAQVNGFAILEERNKLPKPEKRRQDLAREEIEAEYETKVVAELPDIKAYCQSIA